jgi:hypothetical protein
MEKVIPLIKSFKILFYLKILSLGRSCLDRMKIEWVRFEFNFV